MIMYGSPITTKTHNNQLHESTFNNRYNNLKFESNHHLYNQNSTTNSFMSIWNSYYNNNNNNKGETTGDINNDTGNYYTNGNIDNNNITINIDNNLIINDTIIMVTLLFFLEIILPPFSYLRDNQHQSPISSVISFRTHWPILLLLGHHNKSYEMTKKWQTAQTIFTALVTNNRSSIC